MDSTMTASMKSNTDNCTQHKCFYYAFQFKHVSSQLCICGIQTILLKPQIISTLQISVQYRGIWSNSQTPIINHLCNHKHVQLTGYHCSIDLPPPGRILIPSVKLISLVLHIILPVFHLARQFADSRVHSTQQLVCETISQEIV